MIFSSISFLFYFLPLALLAYYIVPSRHRKLRNLVLLIFSLGFYFIGDPRAIIWMLLSILINYLSGLIIGESENKRLRKFVLVLSLVSNLSILGYFKYKGFFIENISSLIGKDLPFKMVVMPIGISFYTFQGISYVIDVYRSSVDHKKNPLDVALYISLFPQLIAGPIVRYETIADQIDNREENLNTISLGIARFIVGLSKKMLLANKFGIIANNIFFKNSYLNIGFFPAWFGSFAYALQIFFDFSGYSDMAIGLGKMFGFEFEENFNYPYISKSITEFWRRWHISLGTWFRDYVYIPLGGNKVTRPRHILNIFIVWFLTGFWHGASWNFIFWGLYFAVILLLEKYLFSKFSDRIPSFVKHIYALALILIGWVIFRTENLNYLVRYLKNIFGLQGWGNLDLVTFNLRQFFPEIILGILFSTPCLKNFERGKINLLNFLIYSGLFILAVISILASSFNPFIYFRF